MCHSLKHSAVAVSTIGHVCLSGTSFKCICTHTSARLRHLRVTRVVGGGLETGCSGYQERVAPEPPARVVGGRLETGWSGYQERVAHYLYDGHSGPRLSVPEMGAAIGSRTGAGLCWHRAAIGSRTAPKGGSAPEPPYWPIWVLAYVLQKQWLGPP